MNSSFFSSNRARLCGALPDGALLLVYSGAPVRKTADEDYPFFADTNFFYLTGIRQANSVLMCEKSGGEVKETLFTLPPDPMKERWTGARITPDAAHAVSGVADVRPVTELCDAVRKCSGSAGTLAFDLDDMNASSPSQTRFQAAMRELLPALPVVDVRPDLRRLRTVKAPCEIEAMRRAEELTRLGILSMMRASRPGMYEYEYKAVWDSVLTSHGCLEPAFPSIISAGKNNFCIHYYSYTGQARDGDMILNDVGAQFDGVHTDVSRGFPCNGKFSDRQRVLFECAYRTSEHMFGLLRPGVPMSFVDSEIHRYCGGLLCDIGLLDKPENEARYMWHGGAHHVGFDTHDMTDARGEMMPGWVFCVDVGIYVEEWGIGFRLEDNCLITKDGCENLSKDTPRTVADIEAAMGH